MRKDKSIKKIYKRRFVTIRVSIEEKENLIQMAINNKKDISSYVREKLGFNKQESVNGE